MLSYRNPLPYQRGEVLRLRWDVLRDPSLPMDETITDSYDADPSTIHGAVYESLGFGTLRLCGTGRIHTPEEAPNVRQVRYMATHPEWRGRGIGSMLLSGMEEQMRQQITDVPASLLVANARISALPFYYRHGYETVGDDFELVGIPHIKIQKQI